MHVHKKPEIKSNFCISTIFNREFSTQPRHLLSPNHFHRFQATTWQIKPFLHDFPKWSEFFKNLDANVAEFLKRVGPFWDVCLTMHEMLNEASFIKFNAFESICEKHHCLEIKHLSLHLSYSKLPQRYFFRFLIQPFWMKLSLLKPDTQL